MKNLNAVFVAVAALISSASALADISVVFRNDIPLYADSRVPAVFMDASDIPAKQQQAGALEQCYKSGGTLATCKKVERSPIGSCANPLYHFAGIAMHNTGSGNRAFLACAQSAELAGTYASKACKKATGTTHTDADTCAIQEGFEF